MPDFFVNCVSNTMLFSAEMADNDEAGSYGAHHASEDELKKHYHLQYLNSQGHVGNKETEEEYDPARIRIWKTLTRAMLA